MSDLTMYRGDSASFVAVVHQADEIDVFDLTGSKVYFTAKVQSNDADESAVMSLDTVGGGVTITDASNGVFTVDILPTNTSSLSLIDGRRQLVYDVQVKTPADAVYTIDIGTLTVLEDITRRFD